MTLLLSDVEHEAQNDQRERVVGVLPGCQLQLAGMLRESPTLHPQVAKGIHCRSMNAPP